ncbi:hypothetical protein [Streptomyces sp. NPDC001770]
MNGRAHRPHDRAVQARFQVRESPGVTVASADDGAGGGDGDGREGRGRDTLFDAARRAAERALAEEGRGYLGGHLELRTPGGVRAARGARGRRLLHHAVSRAAALAVTATLRGDGTRVAVRAPDARPEPSAPSAPPSAPPEPSPASTPAAVLRALLRKPTP